MKRIISIISALFLVLSVCCSCGKAETSAVPKYQLPKKLSAAKSGTLAENSSYRLDWDYDLKCITLTDVNSGDSWSTIPEEYLKTATDTEEIVSSNLSVSLKITYIEPKQSLQMETDSAELLSNGGFIAAKRIENGIRLTYYFTEVEISVPVEYVLEQSGLTVSIIPEGITEGENKLYSVALLPFFASAKNNTDSYAFVPSGSGAIMYTDDTDRQARSYSEPVFGHDEAFQTTFKNQQTESVRLPVFGMKNGNKAMLGIIENGAECANIEAKTGDSGDGFSSVYTVFLMRGYANAYVKDVNGNNSEVKKYTNGIVDLDRMTVRYSLLSGENVGISEMAAAYREYLGLEPNEKADSPELMLTFYGGAQIRKLFLGIPYQAVVGVTDFDSAQSILADVQKNTGVGILANLKGFGESGLDYGELGGGFIFGSHAGSKKEFASLNDWCSEQGIVLSTELDLVHFNNSANGYSASFDTAITANEVAAKKYYYSVVTHEQNTELKAASFLMRGLTESLTKSVTKMTERYSLSAVTLGTLSNTAYSDYESDKYYNKANTAKDFEKTASAIKKNNTLIIADNANSYAAVKADYILNTPTSSSQYNDLDMDVPFYQMVFRGSVPISSRAINLADEARTEFLKAVSTGSSLYFTVCHNVGDEFIVGVHDALAVSEYSGISGIITEYVNESKELLSKVSDSLILSYQRDGNLSRTEFSNGTVVYVNFGNTEKKTELGTVKAQSFIYR